jgi:hypothetical protein
VATAEPTGVTPSYKVIVAPASAVPVNVGVVTLVIASVEDEPLSLAAVNVGGVGAAGAVLSIVRVWLVAEPVFPAVSVWVADRVRLAWVERTVVRVRLQAPELHVAVAGTVARPLISGRTVVESPLVAPHVPPIEVTLAFVE